MKKQKFVEIWMWNGYTLKKLERAQISDFNLINFIGYLALLGFFLNMGFFFPFVLNTSFFGLLILKNAVIIIKHLSK